MDCNVCTALLPIVQQSNAEEYLHWHVAVTSYTPLKNAHNATLHENECLKTCTLYRQLSCYPYEIKHGTEASKSPWSWLDIVLSNISNIPSPRHQCPYNTSQDLISDCSGGVCQHQYPHILQCHSCALRPVCSSQHLDQAPVTICYAECQWWIGHSA